MYNMQIKENPTMFKISEKEELEMMRDMEEEEEQLTGMKKKINILHRWIYDNSR